ncbi:hypothetical protein PYW08_003979 [Mythimna loreyi]|uniref:Uncharacterized protein n=1 Tax=Mythimna loreyi TaxID=667449 RepID=A0ACC2QYE4_9NEOP|nr:hypothetical protein PYW08_003979 [Mythimna loreyi]
MLCPKRALLCAVLLAVLLDPISGRRRSHNRLQKPKEDGYPLIKPDKSYKNNYRYEPPEMLLYSTGRDRGLRRYPVYQGPPPNYLYTYKNSGSKYSTLLTGLALLNLGVLGAAAYSHLKQNTRRTSQPNEVCKFEVRKDNGDFEATKIDCQIISSFILDDEAHSRAKEIEKEVDTEKNITILNMPYQTMRRTQEPTTAYEVLYEMLHNGILVKVTDSKTTVTTEPPPRLFTSSVVIVVTTTENNTIVNALDVKGKEVEVTPGMQCYVTRVSPVHNMTRKVSCGLLQQYADTSIRFVNADPSHDGTNGTCRSYVLAIMTTIAVFCVL